MFAFTVTKLLVPIPVTIIYRNIYFQLHKLILISRQLIDKIWKNSLEDMTGFFTDVSNWELGKNIKIWLYK